MKIVKLNRRFNLYRDGFTHALRWDQWEYNKIDPYEKAFAKLYGGAKYNYREANWAAMFGGKRGTNGFKPYFIYVRSEAMISAAMLGVST